MNLANQTDSEILNGLTTWIGKERECTSHVLLYLKEVEERKLFLRFSSTLFSFCMDVHGYSRHEAQSRVDAMRLMKSVPEIDADLDAGRLSLTVAAQTQSAFRKEDQRRKESGDEPLSIEEQKTVLADLMSASTREADRKLATHFPDQPPPEKAKPISKDITLVQFSADSDEMKMYESLQAKYFHQTGGSWQKLFALLAKREIERLDAPLRRAPGAQTQKTRYIQKHVRRDVWSHWHDGCEFPLANGKACGSHQNLQLDHIIEFSKGGSNARENLRLLCAAHNRGRSNRLDRLFTDFNKRIESCKRLAMGSFSESPNYRQATTRVR